MTLRFCYTHLQLCFQKVKLILCCSRNKNFTGVRKVQQNISSRSYTPLKKYSVKVKYYFKESTYRLLNILNLYWLTLLMLSISLWMSCWIYKKDRLVVRVVEQVKNKVVKKLFLYCDKTQHNFLAAKEWFLPISFFYEAWGPIQYIQYVVTANKVYPTTLQAFPAYVHPPQQWLPTYSQG